MSTQSIFRIAIPVVCLTFISGNSLGQKARSVIAPLTAGAEPAEADRATNNADPQSKDESSLNDQDAIMVKQAMLFAEECTEGISKWLSSNEITEDKLFSFLYYPQEGTNPTKFNTDYDSLSDRDLQPILEKHLIAQPDTVYAVIQDKNGYIPTHNLKYSQKPTGDKAKDLVGNRTKRIFADKTGLAAGRSQQPYLIQSYKRDTGQIMTDLSVPIFINEKHWGCIRIGYLRSE